MIYQFLEDIRLAAASGQGHDKINSEDIADLYGHSPEYVQSLIRHERKAQEQRKAQPAIRGERP